MDLVAVEEIKRLKHRYFRSLDLKDWATFGDCLTVDVRARYGTQAMDKPVHYDSRDAVVGFMTDNLGPGVVTVHIANHPEIDVDGDSATGSWAFEDTVIVPEMRVLIRGAGYYRDEYRRDADGSWRIAATSYERIYEAMTSLDDTPSFTLLANRWDPTLQH
ncbi:nuclear transport factor 2 family protein [Nocardioides antri]|uniref:Nuclear transport factor 2 family protein n=1 Tax=Nocardioides antri TaxID=2607659 RepID=A0A5B1LYN9_9ACTN|nr:nuclear transport factor 2 family protein [Nocardioides antri]KAA1425614.1 nuclear transport factor 2 family protein [Nocardioides antri]